MHIQKLYTYMHMFSQLKYLKHFVNQHFYHVVHTYITNPRIFFIFPFLGISNPHSM